MRKSKAFTLVELLVVIGIIAVLISVLLPVLGRARAEANKIKCESNMRTMLQSITMYVSENKNTLPSADWGGYYRWGWLYDAQTAGNPWRPEDVKTGVLWPYQKTLQIYHCPIHWLDGAQGTEILTSYLMNGAVVAYGNGPTSGGIQQPKPAFKITKFRRPSEQIMLWEAEERGNGSTFGGVSWNDGSSYPWENRLTRRHGRGACVGCFDSHVEWMEYADFENEVNRSGQTRLWCNPITQDGGPNQTGH